MAYFGGTFMQTFDQKWRVSVPAPFRAALKDGSDKARKLSALIDGAIPIPLVLRPSEKADCIEGWTEDRFAELTEVLDKLHPLSEEYDELAMVVYGDAYPTETDKEGRIIISDALLAHAGLSRAPTGKPAGGLKEPVSVAFIGLGKRFQLWQSARK